MLLAVVLVADTAHLVALFVDAGDPCFLDDLHPLRVALDELLQPLHQRVGDGHARELCIVAAVRAWLRVAAEPRDEGQVEVEDILQPLHSGGGLVGQHFDEIRPCLVACRFDGVVVELLDAVADLLVDLRPSQSAVDARGGLGRVATEEV